MFAATEEAAPHASPPSCGQPSANAFRRALRIVKHSTCRCPAACLAHRPVGGQIALSGKQNGAATAVVVSGGGGGGGDDPALQERGELLTGVKMLLLCGTLPKNFNTPFRLFGGGHIELLRYIADLSAMWATPTGCPSR